MNTTFEDNQAVTLADFNNIAVDLGDTTFSAFSEEKFGVDELNNITKDLVTSGILKTEDNGNGGLNMGCKPTIEDNLVTIGLGTIVFASGAKVYVDSEMVYAADGSYIYAFNDTFTGRASLKVSDTEPTEGDFVMIAKVIGYGSLQDLRKFAQAKVLLPAGNVLQNFDVEFSGVVSDTTLGVYRTGIVKINAELQGVKHIVFWDGEMSIGTNVYNLSPYNGSISSFDDSAQAGVTVKINNSTSTRYSLVAAKQEDGIEIYVKRADGSNFSYVSCNVSIGII